ncbi:MAG: hypothetical protein GX572_01300 [Clostridia bacterium]|nr:hypothetical protein [Clostridia bacterium]
MLRKIVQAAVGIFLAVIGIVLAAKLLSPLLLVPDKPIIFYYGALALIGIIMAVLGILLSLPLLKLTESGTERIAANFATMSASEIAGRIIGLITGLIIASLLGFSLSRIDLIGPYISIIAVLLFSYLGWLTGGKLGGDIFLLRAREPRVKAEKKPRGATDEAEGRLTPKVLDTSVIIDGRIADIYRTGFLEGDLVIANFVLEELRHIADSSDSLKRNRGRGGLDTLNLLRDQFNPHVVITQQDYPKVAEVDSKLLRLAQDLGGVVVTNDFNLNKVARLQGMQVLNINELANAVKPIVLPGEEMIAHVIKEGKEANQGVAYLDDGTMIVVENGARYVGMQLAVIVTSILQTSAGRMVFARPKLDKRGEIVELKANYAQNK